MYNLRQSSLTSIGLLGWFLLCLFLVTSPSSATRQRLVSSLHSPWLPLTEYPVRLPLPCTTAPSIKSNEAYGYFLLEFSLVTKKTLWTWEHCDVLALLFVAIQIMIIAYEKPLHRLSDFMLWAILSPFLAPSLISSQSDRRWACLLWHRYALILQQIDVIWVINRLLTVFEGVAARAADAATRELHSPRGPRGPSNRDQDNGGGAQLCCLLTRSVPVRRAVSSFTSRPLFNTMHYLCLHIYSTTAEETRP